MINIKDIDISSLTKEQLISLLNESKNDVDTLLAISKKLADDNSRLTDNNNSSNRPIFPSFLTIEKIK